MVTLMPVRYVADLPLYKTEKLYTLSSPELSPDDDLPPTNVQFEVRQTQLRDLREHQPDLPFEKHCFKFIQYTAKAHPERDPEQILTYCEEMVMLLRMHVQADKFLCYNFKIRKNHEAIQKDSMQGLTGPALPDSFFEAAHVDHTRTGGWDRVARHLTRDEKETYLDGTWRIRIWNMWKPTVPVVEDTPLALCDPMTVDEQDLWPCDQVGPASSGPPGEIYYVRPSKNQGWYWLPRQTAEELYIFLSWDSHPVNGKLNFCPHAAFTDPSHIHPTQRRESVEARVVTFSRLPGNFNTT